MSVDAFRWALAQQVTGSSKSMLLVLAWRMNSRTGLCCPSVDQIADDCGLTRWAVQRQLTKLSESGVINIEKRFGSVLGGRSNDYNFPAFIPTGRNVTLVEQSNGTKTTDQCDAITDQPDVETPIKKVNGKERKKERKGWAPLTARAENLCDR